MGCTVGHKHPDNRCVFRRAGKRSLATSVRPRGLSTVPGSKRRETMIVTAVPAGLLVTQVFELLRVRSREYF